MEAKILPKELKKKLDNKEDIVLLDVRSYEEYKIAKINDSILIPMDELEKIFNELPKKEIVVYCHHGIRSKDATEFLIKKGFNAKTLVGGLDVWSRFIDSSIKQY